MIIYLLPIVAVLLGFFLVLLFKPKKKKNLKLLLAFSGAFLLGTTIYEFLPSVFNHSDNSKQISVCIVIGILFQICLEFFSKGAEHGHVHLNEKNNKFPLSLFISLSLHSIFEGVPLHGHEAVLYGVFIHKIPIALILTIFLLNTSLERYKVFIFIFLFAIMTPIGSLVVEKLNLTLNQINYISAITIGIFLHISTTILFESTEGHKFNLVKLLIIVLGLASAYFV